MTRGRRIAGPSDVHMSFPRYFFAASSTRVCP